MNIGMRLAFMKQYTAIDRQHGKVNATLSKAAEESDLTEAIKLARKARGHIAVILKQLHEIKRLDHRR